jgi:signal transduction histidine kinase/CheY-like chemotaxis protein
VDSSPAKVGADRNRPGLVVLLVLLLGVGVTIVLFLVGRANVQHTQQSLLHERTSQTVGLVETVVQQLEAIFTAGGTVAEYTHGDPHAFENAIGARVRLSLLSSLALLRLEPAGPVILTSVGRASPVLLKRLEPTEVARLRAIARSGAGLTSVVVAKRGGARITGFAASPRAGSDFVLYGEITAVGAQAQAGGVAPSDLRFAVYLGQTKRPSSLLLSSPGGGPTGDNVVANVLPIGDEELLVELGPRRALVGGFTRAAPWLVLGIGLIGSLALAALVEIARTRRDEALRHVADLERRSSELARALIEQRRAEEELRQAQRMEAVGRLAGGVAHDFNNLLTVIIGYTRLLLARIPSEGEGREEAEQVAQAAERAATLTQQLLAFSRRQVLKPEPLDLNDVVHEMKRLLERLIGEDIELVTVRGPALGTVEADRGQLEQVILNLAVNARDAMPRGGRLLIETANVELDESQLPEHAGGRPGPHVALAVSDTGHGMDDTTLKHAFEPFYTTKEQGKGTGLGLATVYGIVTQSSGSIAVDSKPGHGVTFTIHLPRVDVGAAIPEHPPRTYEDSLRGSEVVLLVEDDVAVRKLVHKVLSKHGYTVLHTDSPREAIAVSERYDGQIDLLLTDVVMPEMSGRELSDLLSARRPTMQTLYMSGYVEEAIGQHGVLDEGIAFIGKPFAPDLLVRKLRTVLGEPATDVIAHGWMRRV